MSEECSYVSENVDKISGDKVAAVAEKVCDLIAGTMQVNFQNEYVFFLKLMDPERMIVSVTTFDDDRERYHGQINLGLERSDFVFLSKKILVEVCNKMYRVGWKAELVQIDKAFNLYKDTTFIKITGSRQRCK